MKLLLDMGASPRTAAYLRSLGYDAQHVRERGWEHLSDEEIMRLAEVEKRAIITFDLDFSRILALQRRSRPSVILFRLEQFSTDDINAALTNLLSKNQSMLEAGAIAVIDPHRVRFRKLPIW